MGMRAVPQLKLGTWLKCGTQATIVIGSFPIDSLAPDSLRPAYRRGDRKVPRHSHDFS